MLYKLCTLLDKFYTLDNSIVIIGTENGLDVWK